MDQRKRNLIYVCSPRMKENDGMGITLSNWYDIKYYKKQCRKSADEFVTLLTDAKMERTGFKWESESFNPADFQHWKLS